VFRTIEPNTRRLHTIPSTNGPPIDELSKRQETREIQIWNSF